LAMQGIKKIVLALVFFLLLGAYFVGIPTQAGESDRVAAAAFQRGNRLSASFPHEESKHSGLDCAECHRISLDAPDDIKGVGSKIGSAYPGHEACIRCHTNFAELALREAFGQSKVFFCSICHNGSPRSVRQPALFPKIPKPRGESDFGERFSHEAHRKNLENVQISAITSRQEDLAARFKANEQPNCVDCHSIVKKTSATTPDMTVEKNHSTCFECHGAIPASGRKYSDPKKFPYANDCVACHRTALRNQPQSPRVFGIPRFKHEDHDYEIRPIRKRDFVQMTAEQRRERLCIECHHTIEKAETLSEIKLPEPDTCARCHMNKAGLPYKEGIGLPDALEGDVLEKLRSAARSGQ
jgi:nitrate/TMAO reductase-like tetraheme cytochrome c subunit